MILVECKERERKVLARKTLKGTLVKISNLGKAYYMMIHISYNPLHTLKQRPLRPFGFISSLH